MDGRIDGWVTGGRERICRNCIRLWASLVAQLVKNLPGMRDTWVQSLGWEDPLEKGMATHSSILAWRIPWTVLYIYSPWGRAKSRARLSDSHLVGAVASLSRLLSGGPGLPSSVRPAAFSAGEGWGVRGGRAWVPPAPLLRALESPTCKAPTRLPDPCTGAQHPSL